MSTKIHLQDLAESLQAGTRSDPGRTPRQVMGAVYAAVQRLVDVGDEATLLEANAQLEDYLADSDNATEDASHYMPGVFMYAQHQILGQLRRLEGRKVRTALKEHHATFREQVLDLITSRKDPAQPSQIASELDADRAQVSRAIRELCAQDAIEEVASPKPASDKRTRYYATADPERTVPVRTGAFGSKRQAVEAARRLVSGAIPYPSSASDDEGWPFVHSEGLPLLEKLERTIGEVKQKETAGWADFFRDVSDEPEPSEDVHPEAVVDAPSSRNR